MQTRDAALLPLLQKLRAAGTEDAVVNAILHTVVERMQVPALTETRPTNHAPPEEIANLRLITEFLHYQGLDVTAEALRIEAGLTPGMLSEQATKECIQGLRETTHTETVVPTIPLLFALLIRLSEKGE